MLQACRITGSIICANLRSQIQGTSPALAGVIQVRHKGQRGTRPKILRCRSYGYKKNHLTKVPPKYHTELDEAPLSGTAPIRGIAEVRDRELLSDIQSIRNKGFLRFQAAYTPPEDVNDRILDIMNSTIPGGAKLSRENLYKVQLTDSSLKYDILTKTAAEFSHAVPNSLLCHMNSVEAIISFYNREIDVRTPYDALIAEPNLPPNLHVQKDPVRFTEATKHFFGGKTAFPQSSTVITNLRAKQKYEAFKAKKVVERW